MTALWLKNVYLLHDLLTQHSLQEVRRADIHHMTDGNAESLLLFQTLGSDELVPLSTNMSDLIRALSDLCIQAYQQLLSITEKRLHAIIGAAMSMLYPPLLLLFPSYRLFSPA